jgi:integrase
MAGQQLRDGVIRRGGTWSYVIRVTDGSGISKPRWVGGFAIQAEAKAARDEARVAARRGQFVHRNQMTVECYLTTWLQAHALEVRPKTHEDYRSLLHRYVIPRIGKMRLQSVKPATLYTTLRREGGANGQGLSPRTVNYVHSVLRKAFNDAVKRRPVAGGEPGHQGEAAAGRRGEAGAPGLERRAARRLPRRSEGRPAVSVLPAGGVHLSSSRRTALPDVVQRGPALRRPSRLDSGLHGDRPRSSGRRGDQDGAGTASEPRPRHGPGSPSAAERQARERELVGPSWPDSDRVFRMEMGTPLGTDLPGELMRDTIRKQNNNGAKLPAMRFHDLRHVHATLLLQAGEPVHVVAARLGHADPSMTLRVYAHVLTDQAVGVAARFAEVMGEDNEDE